MDHLHKAAAAAAQIVPPWVGVAIGHFVGNITLQNIALVSSIAYSIVGTLKFLRKQQA